MPRSLPFGTGRARTASASICAVAADDRWSRPGTATMVRSMDRIDDLAALLEERIVILDGAWGVLLQGRGLTEEDFRGERFRDHPSDVKGDPDLLNLTRPDIVTELHLAYLEAGADITTTNTFTATSVGQADYGLTGRRLRHERRGCAPGEAARPSSTFAARFWRVGRPAERDALHVAQGGRGVVPDDLVRPGVRGLRRADPRPARRRRRPAADRDDLRHAEREGRDRGGDGHRAGAPAVALGDDHRPERTHAVGSDDRGVLDLDRARRADDRRRQLLARAPREMRPYVEDARARRADPRRAATRTPVSRTRSAATTRPPRPRAACSASSRGTGLVNIVGGCCGTTPEHIRMIADTVHDLARREGPDVRRSVHHAERPRAVPDHAGDRLRDGRRAHEHHGLGRSSAA